MATLDRTEARTNEETQASVDTLARVKQVVLEAMCLDNREFTRETSLMGDLSADSLDMVQISMGLEETFGIDFGEDTLMLTTAGQIVDYIEAKTGNGNADVPYM